MTVSSTKQVSTGSRWRKVRRILKRLCQAGALLACLAGVAYLLLPDPGLYPDDLDYSKVLADRDGKVIHLALTKDERYRVYTPLEKICGELVDATLFHEDRHFRSHPGVNPMSLLRATWGMVARTPRGGGSTITMQLARLRFNLATVSVGGKFVQIFRAIQLERHYSKNQILTAYFNLAPYGGNVEGIEAASLVWCGKSAGELTRREAVSLAVIPQSPASRRPKFSADNAALAHAQFRLWRRLAEEDGRRVDPLDEDYVIRQEARVPREVPHLARRLLGETDADAACRSTINLKRQHQIEAAIRDYIVRHRQMGITNACSILIHAPSREVLAYVGSADFLEKEIQGQVDGVTARRSPGSALKPFVYAMAVDRGLIHGRTLVRDAKRSFGDYNPENFDRGFVGPIAASDALYHSRNIPAVTLAAALGEGEFYRFLRQSGVKLPKAAEHYGLSLPLGGGEVSMEEMGKLYAMLATDGRARELVFTMPFSRDVEENPMPPRVLDEGACFIVRDMLRPREYDVLADDPDVHWKTGTSHGFRDAWAAAIYGDYVLIVWVGNFDGKGNPAFVARESAAPLLFEMLGRMRLPVRAETPPESVKQLKLCAVSGSLPGPHCQHVEDGWFLPGISPIKPCTIHREVLVDRATGRRKMFDDGTAEFERKVYEFWPSDMLELFRLAGLPRSEPPPLDASKDVLMAADTNAVPLIVSPQESVVYALSSDEKQRDRIPLRADAAPGVKEVFWFANERFVGRSNAGDVLFWEAEAGSWTIQVLDDSGRSNSTRITVEQSPASLSLKAH